MKLNIILYLVASLQSIYEAKFLKFVSVHFEDSVLKGRILWGAFPEYEYIDGNHVI